MLLNTLNGEGTGDPPQYSCLETSMDGGALWAAVHGVAKSRTRLSDFTFTFYFHALEKEMATHSSVLAWRIPGTGEPGGLPSMGLHRVGHDWSDLAACVWDRDLSKMKWILSCRGSPECSSWPPHSGKRGHPSQNASHDSALFCCWHCPCFLMTTVPLYL